MNIHNRIIGYDFYLTKDDNVCAKIVICCNAARFCDVHFYSLFTKCTMQKITSVLTGDFVTSVIGV